MERFTAYRPENGIETVYSRCGTGSGGRSGTKRVADCGGAVAADCCAGSPLYILSLPSLQQILGPQRRGILSLLRQKNGIGKLDFGVFQECQSEKQRPRGIGSTGALLYPEGQLP